MERDSTPPSILTLIPILILISELAQPPFRKTLQAASLKTPIHFLFVSFGVALPAGIVWEAAKLTCLVLSRR